MMRTASLGRFLGVFLVSVVFIASVDAEERTEGNALPALAGYSVRIWTKGTSDFTNPDSIESDGGHIWIGYQNVTSKTGGDGMFSTVVEYDSDGRLLRTFAVPGHCDGLRIDPATHTVWASSNEDGNPGLVAINQSSGKITPYSFDPTAHGGGFDDMAFLNGRMFIAASNPNLDSNGANVFPAIDEVTFNGTKVVLTPVLMGNAKAVDTSSGQVITLNEVDPDSLTIDGSGRLVLVNQAGAELVFISSPGTASQSVSRTSVGTQLEDTGALGINPLHPVVMRGDGFGDKGDNAIAAPSEILLQFGRIGCPNAVKSQNAVMAAVPGRRCITTLQTKLLASLTIASQKPLHA